MARFVADPTFADFNDLFPFNTQEEKDFIDPYNFRFEYFPPTAGNDAPIVETNGKLRSSELPQSATSDARGLGNDLKTKQTEYRSEMKYLSRGRISDEDAVRWVGSHLEEIKKQMKVDVGRVTRLASYHGCITLLKHLLDHEGASLTSRDILGRSAIFYAIANDQCWILESVASSVPQRKLEDELNSTDAYGVTPLHLATRAHSMTAVQYCLANGATSHGAKSDGANASRLIRLLGIGNSYQGNLMSEELWRVISAQSEDLTNVRNVMLYYTNNCHRMGGTYFCIKPRRLYAQLQLLPAVSDQGRIWIHVPWTNATLGASSFGDARFHDQSSEFLLRGFRDPPTVSGNPYLNYRVPIYETNPKDKRMVSITFPCLMLADMQSFKKARNYHIKCRKTILFPDANKFLQTERTLDEAEYPLLDQDDLDIRNQEQVVSRECRKLLDGSIVIDKSKPILMVPQLWIWIFGVRIFSAFSGPASNFEWVEEFKHDPQQFMRSKGFCEILTEVYRRGDEPVDLGLGIRQSLGEKTVRAHVASMLAEQVHKFGGQQADNKYQCPLDIFEIGVVRVSSEVNKYMSSAKPSDLTIDKETKWMYDIFDIQDEVGMIEKVFRQEVDVLDGFMNDLDLEQGQKPETEAYETLKDAKARIQTYLDRVSKIQKDAGRVDASIKDQLSLKRAYASMNDIQASKRTADVSLVLGAAVIGFAITTIVFAPLAFMSALFALPIDFLVKKKDKPGNEGVYKMGFVAWTFVLAELATIVISCIVVKVTLLLLPRSNDQKEKPKAKERISKTPETEFGEEVGDGTEKQIETLREEPEPRLEKSFFSRGIRKRQNTVNETIV